MELQIDFNDPLMRSLVLPFLAALAGCGIIRLLAGEWAIQLEINRRLYLDEASGRLQAKGARRLQECLGELAQSLRGLELAGQLPLAAE